MLLGAASGPSVELIDVARGDRVPWPDVVSGPFDTALSRDGWMALQTGYAVHSVRDGDLGSLRRLPDVWLFHPAADPALLLARLRNGCGLALLDADGTILERSDAMTQPAGELPGGTVVCERELRTWAGDPAPLPIPGRTVAVLDGRYLVTHADGVLRSCDTVDGRTAELDGRAHRLRHLGVIPAYDRGVQRAAWTNDGVVFVAGPGLELRAVPHSFPAYRPVWLTDDHLLLVGDRETRVLDLGTGELEAIDGIDDHAWPRLDVTGRLDPRDLRDEHTATEEQPVMDADAWQTELTRQFDLIADAASEAGLGPEVAASARPALRLAPRVGPGPVGCSRLGGIPDVPAGWSWPRHDGAPLAFLAQLRLDALHPGLVSMFATIRPDADVPAEPYLAHVEVFAPGTDLAAAVVPDELTRHQRYDPAAVVAEPYLSPPNWDALEPAYAMEPVETFYPRLQRPQPHHQSLGLAYSSQGHPPPDGRVLLLQLDSDGIMGVMWGDGGRIFIWGPPELPASGVVAGCELDLESGG